jgi:magnesium-transporting ATPase (P-type)
MLALLLTPLLVLLLLLPSAGIMLAAEPAEPTVMDRPPRRPGKRLLVRPCAPHLCFGRALLLLCVFYSCHNMPMYSQVQRPLNSMHMLVCNLKVLLAHQCSHFFTSMPACTHKLPGLLTRYMMVTLSCVILLPAKEADLVALPTKDLFCLFSTHMPASAVLTTCCCRAS